MHEEIGVVVPVYNAEKYIGRCLTSLENQTFQNFVIIIVNDESTDDGMKICTQYQNKDSRIKIVHKKNGGAADARYFGWKYAYENSDCKWVCFVDSDDLVSPYYLDYLYRAVTEYDTQIAVCSVKEIDNEKNADHNMISYYASRKNSIDFYVNYNFIGFSPCNKLYDKTLFANENFPCGKLFDDILFTHLIMKKVDEVAFINLPLYYYFINNNSVSRSAYTKKSLVGIDAYKKRYEDFLCFASKEQTDIIYKRYVECIVYNITKLKELNEKEDAQIIRELEERAKRLVCDNKTITINNSPGVYLVIGNPFQKLYVKFNCKLRTIFGLKQDS